MSGQCCGNKSHNAADEDLLATDKELFAVDEEPDGELIAADEELWRMAGGRTPGPGCSRTSSL